MTAFPDYMQKDTNGELIYNLTKQVADSAIQQKVTVKDAYDTYYLASASRSPQQQKTKNAFADFFHL